MLVNTWQVALLGSAHAFAMLAFAVDFGRLGTGIKATGISTIAFGSTVCITWAVVQAPPSPLDYEQLWLFPTRPQTAPIYGPWY